MKLSSIGKRYSDREPMVDVEKLLLRYAWTELSDANFVDRLFKNKKYLLEVNWSYLDITHQLSSFKIRDHPNCLMTSDEGKDKSNTNVDKMRSKVMQRDLCLFRTEFHNSSENEQSFTLKAERKTTSRCDISIQRGFRLGSNVDVRFTIPSTPNLLSATNPEALDTCRITGGLSGELQVSKTTGQTIEENLSWGVDNQVKVAKRSRTVASLLIREEDMMADFIITSTITALNSVIPVYIKDKKSKRILEILEIPAQNLSDILGDSHGFERVDENVVKCQTKGTMRAIYGAEQLIKVESFPDD